MIQYRGQDLPVFSVEPNWETPVELRVTDRVIVREALDTSEERIATRPRPLYGLNYATKELTEQETGYIRRAVELADELPFVMPVWSDRVRLLADVVEGGQLFSVDSTENSLWSTLNAYALIWRSFNEWELVQLGTVGSGSILSIEGVSAAWAGDGDTYLIPVLVGYLARGDKRQITDDHGIFQVRFEERFPAEAAEADVVPDPVADSASNQTGFSDGEYTLSFAIPELPEAASTSAAFVEGDYVAIVEATSGEDAGSTATEFREGVYAEIVEPAAGDDDGENSAAFRSGLYKETIIEVDAGAEDGSNGAAFQAGEYVEVVELLDLGGEDVSQGTGFHSGSYAAA